jgi:hypothetical protein
MVKSKECKGNAFNIQNMLRVKVQPSNCIKFDNFRHAI